MKKLYTLFIILGIALTCQSQVTISNKLDSVQFFVGQQDGLEIQVSMGANQKLTLPQIKPGDEIIPNVEVVEVLKPDTQQLNDGAQLQITQRYIITAWDSSFYCLPPFQVLVDRKPYKTKSLAFKVYTVDVDTVHVDQFFPPREIMDNPFSWDDWKGVMWSGFIVVLLGGLIAYLWWRVKTGKPIFRLVRHRKKLPPHQVAISEIHRIKDEKVWAKEDSKEYYTLLTDTLRTYIQDRYGFSAMEMTSQEIIDKLVAEGDEKSLDELRDIFRTADLVKFAKWSTQINENDAALMSALYYVNETKQEVDPNAQPEPEVVKETDKKRLNEVIASQIAMGTAALVIVCIIAWVAYRLWDLLS